MPTVYLATICLERNRWGSKTPSFEVSDWLSRIQDAGFDGVELWENHFLAATDAERDRLAASEITRIYNTYTGFDTDDADSRSTAAAAICRLRPHGVKYNLGANPTRLDVYRQNLLAWSDQLPPTCRLLCECHPGTVLEEPDAARAFFADLDPQRFGAIAHVSPDTDALARWFEALDGRITHLHVQYRGPESDPRVPANRERLDAGMALLRARDYRAHGTLTIEFTRGIGRDESMEALFGQARADLAYIREQLSTHPVEIPQP